MGDQAPLLIKCGAARSTKSRDVMTLVFFQNLCRHPEAAEFLAEPRTPNEGSLCPPLEHRSALRLPAAKSKVQGRTLAIPRQRTALTGPTSMWTLPRML